MGEVIKGQPEDPKVMTLFSVLMWWWIVESMHGIKPHRTKYIIPCTCIYTQAHIQMTGGKQNLSEISGLYQCLILVVILYCTTVRICVQSTLDLCSIYYICMSIYNYYIKIRSLIREKHLYHQFNDYMEFICMYASNS